MEVWIQIFKVGEQTDSEGITRQWSPEDLNSISDNFNNDVSQNGESAWSPIIKGHSEPVDIKSSDSACGWVKALKVTDGVLEAFVEFNPSFVPEVQDGQFKKVSASFYIEPELNLRHVAMLGAMPPAVKGLEPVKFASNKKFQTYNFSIPERPIQVSISKNRKSNFPIINSGVQMDPIRTLQQELLTEVANALGEEVSQQVATILTPLVEKYFPAKTDSTPADGTTPPASTDKQTKDTTTHPAQFSEQQKMIIEQQKMMTEQQKEIDKLKMRVHTSDFVEWYNSKKQLTPAQREIVKINYDFATLETVKSVSFSENGKITQLGRLDAFNKFVDTIPEAVQFNEFATKDRVAEQSENEWLQSIKEYNERRK